MSHSNRRLYWLHCLSPTHAGIGRGIGYIDLPIDRDSVTHWPIIRGSGFKGVWADHFRATNEARRKDPQLKAAFGLAGENDDSNAGSLIATDAQIVCLPVRSFRGTFAWATSPLCLRMLRRTLKLAGVGNLPQEFEGPTDDVTAHHAQGTALKEVSKIYLEDLDFTTHECETATEWGEKIGSWTFGESATWATEFKKRFVVLPNLAFDFLCETGTEVQTRVKIKEETKTVEGGALWTEEALPAETILMGLVQCDRVFQKSAEKDVSEVKLLEKFASANAANPLLLQIGGKATVGRGQVRCVFTPVNGGGQ